MVLFAAAQLILLLAPVGRALHDNATIAGKPLISRAVSPNFQAYSQNTQQRQALRDQMVQGFKDALVLASVTALTFNPCEETFLRYFEEDDADLEVYFPTMSACIPATCLRVAFRCVRRDRKLPS